MTGSAEIIRANSRHLPIADDTVDIVVTSPPYFALRSYQDGGEHYKGQIGDEPTPAEFVDSLIEVTRECMRVLKPSGSLWVNLGDKYDSGTSTGRKNGGNRMGDASERQSWNTDKGGPERFTMGRPKSLIGIPWRYALRCIDDLGLILRAEVIWSKPNGLPESVTDRVRRSHEQWFHFTLNPRYFSAVDEIREEYDAKTAQRYAAGYGTKRKLTDAQLSKNTDYYVDDLTTNPLGKLPGSVWTVPTEPLKVPDHLGIDHFAAFPSEWPKRLILGWSPAGICSACGEGRRPVVHTPKIDGHVKVSHPHVVDSGEMRVGANSTVNKSGGPMVKWRAQNPAVHLGYCCACPDTSAATSPAVVLDPFGGTGTTALVAKALGRRGISVDMSADYCRLAEWRTNDPGQLAKVLEQPKPTPMSDGDGQLTWDMVGGDGA